MDETPILDDPLDAEAKKLKGGAAKAGTFVWTANAIDTMQILWTEGKSGSEIAQALGHGLTRSAVLGKLHRLKHPSPRHRVQSRRKKLARHKMKTGGRPKAKPSPPTVIDATLAPLKTALGRRQWVLDGIEEKPLGSPASITELHPAGCKWPTGFKRNRHVFCNHHRLEGQSYCPVHTAASYTEGRR